MKIILIGMPYSGKSTLGKRIAKQFQVPFIDTDQWIEAQMGCFVSDIFAISGEAQFREYETQALKMISQQSAYAVATGGGIVTTQANRELLATIDAKIIYLDVPLRLLEARAARKNGAVRPMLQTKSVRDLYHERRQFYRQLADVSIDCHQKNVAQITAEIIAACRDDLQK